MACTLALFLSGYAIQQRTLRDLRAAIRPRESRPSPRAHLPDWFRASTTELDDGRVVLVEGEADGAAGDERQLLGHAADEAQYATRAPQQQRAEDGDEQRRLKRGPAPSDADARRQRALVEQLQAQMAAKSWGVEHPDPLAKSRVPVTRAERRRLIKAEIQRLAQAEERVYYQRRLW